MNRTLKTLKEVRTLLTEPSVWTQRTLARDATSKPCPPTSVAAVQWDLCGAIERSVYGTQDHYMTPEWTLQIGDAKKQADFCGKLKEAKELHVDVHRLLRFTLLPKITTLEKFNDAPERTHDEIMLVLDATIERVQNIHL